MKGVDKLKNFFGTSSDPASRPVAQTGITELPTVLIDVRSNGDTTVDLNLSSVTLGQQELHFYDPIVTRKGSSRHLLPGNSPAERRTNLLNQVKDLAPSDPQRLRLATDLFPDVLNATPQHIIDNTPAYIVALTAQSEAQQAVNNLSGSDDRTVGSYKFI